MLYIIFHYFIFTISTFLQKNKNNKYIYATLGIIYFGFSYPAGGDFVGYFENYDCIVNNNCTQLSSMEWGFNFITYIFGQLGFQTIIVAIAIFNSICLFKFANNFNAPLFFPIMYSALSWSLYTEAIRQSIATSIVLIAIIYLSEKKFKIFIALIFLAATFHISALIAIFLSINHKIFKKNIKIIIFFGIVVVGILFKIFQLEIFENINWQLIAVEKLIFYFQSDNFKPGLSIGIGVIPDLLLLITIIYNLKHKEMPYWMINGIFIYIIFSLVIGRIMPVGTRLGWYGLPLIALLYKIENQLTLQPKKIFIHLILIIWMGSQVLRQFSYPHALFNIFEQESIFFNIQNLNDYELKNTAIKKCLTLKQLGYDDLCNY